MKPLRLTAILLTLLTANTLYAAKQISVTDFGATPDDGHNDLHAIAAACDYCRRNPGTTLIMPPGIYDIEDPTAMKIEREAIGGAYGERVQQQLFRPGAPYVKAFDLSDCTGTSVKAAGAVLRLKGWYEVMTIDKSNDISIDGLTISYHRPPNTVGRVVASDSLSFDITFDRSRYTFIDSTVTGRVHFVYSATKRLYTGSVTAKQLIDSTTIRMLSPRRPAIGDYAVLRHGGHYRPAIMIKESDNIVISNVKIHSQPGMGIVGHLSSDITIDGLQVVPADDQVISTNTDATHFTSCSGKLTIRNSTFAGQGDDCTNVHNYYYDFKPCGNQSAARIEIVGADLHAQSIDYPSVGDTMVIIDRRNLAEQGRYAVTAVDTVLATRQVTVTFDRQLPTGDLTELKMTNMSRFPTVEITDNVVRSHLARAFLIKSPNARIARNHISGSCETAIKLGAELGWNESGPVHDMIIEDNHIEHCGHCGHPSQPTCVLVNTDARQTPGFVNHDIIIRNNIFITDRRPAVMIRDASDVSLTGNKSSLDNYVVTDNCQNITIDR